MSPRKPVSRRSMLKGSAAALGGTILAGQAGAQNPAPSTPRGSSAGRSFRALVRHARDLTVETLRLRAIQPRQVVIRSMAVAPCYTSVAGEPAPTPAAPPFLARTSGLSAA